MRFPLGRADQAARCARWPPRPGCRSPRAPTRRTSASSPAPARRASSPATRGLEDAAGRDRRRGRRRCSARTAARTTSPSASARASASPPPEPLYVLRTDAARTRVVVGPRDELATRARRACAARGCTGRPPRSTRVRLRYHSPAVPCRGGHGDGRDRARARAGRAVLRRRAGPVGVPAARRRRRRRGRRSARSEVPRRDRRGVADLVLAHHPVDLGDREAARRSGPARCSRAPARPGSSPVARHTSTAWSVSP